MSGQISSIDEQLYLKYTASFVSHHLLQLQPKIWNGRRRLVLLSSNQNTEIVSIFKSNMACSSYQLFKIGYQKRQPISKLVCSSSVTQAQVAIVINLLQSLRWRADLTVKLLKQMRNYSLPAALIVSPPLAVKKTHGRLDGLCSAQNRTTYSNFITWI